MCIRDRLSSPDAQSDDPKQNVEDGGFQQSIENTTGEFIGPDNTFFNFLLTGPIRSQNNETNTNQGINNNPNTFDNVNTVIALLQQVGFPVPYSGLQLGPYGSIGFQNNQVSFDGLEANNATNGQTEAVGFTPSFTNTGVTEESITAKYLFLPEDLFEQAVRRMREIILAQNVWNITTPVMNCVRINQVVTFTVPPTTGCPTREITGIVGGINISKEQGSVPTMQIAVMDTSCLGSTGRQFCSGNLISNACGPELDGVSPFLASELGIQSQTQFSSAGGSIFSTGGANAFFFYSHVNATPDLYRVSFDYTSLTDSATPLRFSQPDNSLIPLIGSGTHSSTFTPNSPNFELRWELLSPDPAAYNVSNLTLTKCVEL